MGVDEKPGPGEELNPGPPTVARPAASVIVLRGGARDLEVLLVKRNPSARFMGGAWVFPGGAIGPGDGEGEPAQRAAGVRELAEEAGLSADPAALVPFSRWITPEAVKIRYDTFFFLHRAEPDDEPQVDGGEVVAWDWFTPQAALGAHRSGEILLVFPTIKHLEQLGGFTTVDDLLDHAHGQEVRPVQPRVVGSGEQARILLPGEAGYEEAGA
ncbi:MAG TPA: NUDIX hydrolase [Solirubrobacteraceae bacterium]|jgi:8-oxo-dGTP pyrophosphatase MutT (NUDIX family)|nr:NUDIX hydrolase [Solirubrobacteraceae bacterium]